MSTVSWYLRRCNPLDLLRTYLLSNLSQEIRPIPPGSRSHGLPSLQDSDEVVFKPGRRSPPQCDRQRTRGRLPCQVCNLQVEAIVLCRTCNAYMCDQCRIGHKQVKLFFEGHEIVSLQDIIEENVRSGRPSEKCSVHKQENKHMFCQDCKIRVSFKCVIIDHRDHKIQSHQDFEKEMQVKVSDLLHRCKAKQSELEKNSQTVETHHHEAHNALQLLREDVGQACRTKVKQLEDNRCALVQKIDALERSFDETFNNLKSKERQMIKSICSSVDLVANDRLGCLETDSLAAHTFLCEEIDGLLMEVIDQTSAATIREKAQKQRFKPADDTSLDLGNISETDAETARHDMLKGAATDDTSAATKCEEVQKERLEFAYEDIRNGISVPEPQSKSQPNLRVIKCVHLRKDFEGMTKYTNNSVAITYYDVNRIDIFNPNDDVPWVYSNIPSGMKCRGIVFQSDMTLCVTTGNTKFHRYSPNGDRKSITEVTNNGRFLRLNRSQSNEILLTQYSNHVFIYDPSGNTLKHDVQTRHKTTYETSATKSGLIVTTSCYSKQYDNPKTVMVYDRDGNSGWYIKAPPRFNLYHAVDELDRVYVASVDQNTGQVHIKLYDIDGLNLEERVQFNLLYLTGDHNPFRMVSLAPHILAFVACDRLYFLEVKL